MKSIAFLVLVFIVMRFDRILDATDKGLLNEVMMNNLEPAIVECNLSRSSSNSSHPCPPASPTPIFQPPSPCPKDANITWQFRPPYTLERSDSDGQPKIGGFFHQALDVALESCCAFYKKPKPNLRYLNASSNSSALLWSVFNETVSLVFPITEDKENFMGIGRAYIKIIESPGVAIIFRNPSYSIKKGENLFKAILGAWPILVLSLLMSCFAGICIWVLDGRRNAKQFGSPSYRGAFDGFWWAFVTMSTVGYGDKTPKSTLARLFSVMWIMIGITICSVLTATLSSALTTVAEVRYDFTTGKTFGVERGSFAFKQAVNLGINITGFETLFVDADELLENEKVEGIIEDMFTAIEFIKSRRGSGLLIHVLSEKKNGYGFVINKQHFNHQVINCLKTVIECLSDEIFSNLSTMTSQMQQMEPIGEAEESGSNIFDPKSALFQEMIIGMSVAVIVFMACSLAFAGARCLRQERSKHLEAGNPKLIREPEVDLSAGEFITELKAMGKDLERE